VRITITTTKNGLPINQLQKSAKLAKTLGTITTKTKTGATTMGGTTTMGEMTTMVETITMGTGMKIGIEIITIITTTIETIITGQRIITTTTEMFPYGQLVLDKTSFIHLAD
jgi:hypothetical protein